MTNQVNKQTDAGPPRGHPASAGWRLTTSLRQSWLIVFVIIVLAAGLYFVRVVHNPPGYYIDESSISYNAYTISETGRDEFGTPWPLYFRAFGDYKNPVYIYLLAAVYRLTGPSILAARLLSATLGVLAALAFGLLGWRLTMKREVALLVTLLALLTPWLFEVSRVVLEVALYPLVLALFLLCAQRASTRPRWSWRDVVCLATTLTLITYTYSIGRLLGPLLAAGLIFFAARARRPGLLLTWLMYFVTLVPILLFNRRHPGGLTGRFYLITYIDPHTSFWTTAGKFARHFFGNFNPWKLFATGDPNFEQIAHIYGTPLLLAATGFLVVISLWLIFRRHRQEAWWRFIIYCLAVSVVPASLTKEYGHLLRLAPLLVFLTVLTIPALEWLSAGVRKHRGVLAVLVVLMVLQFAIFQWQYHASAHSARRLRQFDNGYPEQIFARAVARPERPIYLADALAIPSYIQAYWNATLQGVPINNFVRLAPEESAPEGALVITTEENCPRCQILSKSEFYTLYIAKGPPPTREPLVEGDFRAAIRLVSTTEVLRAGQQASFRVMVTNDSNSIWLARERSGGRYQVSLGNRWLDRGGNVVINDDGRAALLNDLRPGEQVELNLVVNASTTPGDYLLELDMLQEGVAWFGLKGSATLRLLVRVE
jgi:4-amino-4-deoxy-L-arabinose transferase-like glycosyltransferase